MKITFLFTGKTKISYINSGTDDYFKRLKHYINCEIITLPDLKNTKNMPQYEQIKKEGSFLLKEISPSDFLILLDEKGKRFSSVSFATWIQSKTFEGKNLVMAIGGAYGFSGEVKERSDISVSLSDMTFSHQMVRMILMEQVYRAFTIIRGEPYHHS